MTSYNTLREANIARHAEWTNNQTVDLVWRGTELAGEVGEIIDLMLEADRIGRTGEAEVSGWLEALADELADSVICIDLVAMTAGMPSFDAPSGEGGRPEPSATDILLAACLGSAVGATCNILKKLEREVRQWPGSRSSYDSLHAALNHLYRFIAIIAARYQVDLGAAVRRKFNATSEKVGLETRLA